MGNQPSSAGGCMNLRATLKDYNQLLEVHSTLSDALSPAIEVMTRLESQEKKFLNGAAALCDDLCDNITCQLSLRKAWEDNDVRAYGLDLFSVVLILRVCTSAFSVYLGEQLNASTGSFDSDIHKIREVLSSLPPSNALSKTKAALLNCYVVHKRSRTVEHSEIEERLTPDRADSAAVDAVTVKQAVEDRNVDQLFDLALHNAIHDNSESRTALEKILQQTMFKGNTSIARILLAQGVCLPQAVLVLCITPECPLYDGDKTTRQVMEILFEFSAENIDANATTGREDFTALHLASFLGYSQTVALLLKNGANAESLDGTLSTPLQYLEMAIKEGHLEANKQSVRKIRQALTKKSLTQSQNDLTPLQDSRS